MNSILQRIISAPFLFPLLSALCVSQIFASPLLADGFTNISDVKLCRAIQGEAERLLCYDTVIDGGIFNEQQLKQVQREQFGSNTMPKKSEPAPAPVTKAEDTSSPATAPATKSPPTTDISVDKLTVTIVRSKKDSSGINYFQTSDGQVWKQKNAGNWNITPPYEAEIKAGTLGSFFLVSEGGKSTRVKRVR